jgi:hypothetical protein
MRFEGGGVADLSGVVYGDESQEEVLVTRVSIIYRGLEPLRVKPKYRVFFHGDVLRYGRHTIRYAVTSTQHQRLVTAFMKDYPGVKVDVGASGLERV